MRMICPVCAYETDLPHDHKPDNSGLDDGPPIDPPRKKPAPKSREELAVIRAKAWATRRAPKNKSGANLSTNGS